MSADDPVMLKEPSIRDSAWEQTLGMLVEVVCPHVGCNEFGTALSLSVNDLSDISGGSSAEIGREFSCETDYFYLFIIMYINYIEIGIQENTQIGYSCPCVSSHE